MTSVVHRAIDAGAVAALRRGLRGDLFVPGDPGYDDRRRIWNRMIDRHPALVARVADVDDTRVALAFARERGLPVAIRGGGHNVAGTAMGDGALVIDHTARRAITLDDDRRRVAIEPGVLIGELDAATVPLGIAVPNGINTTTGVAGLTLGGGIGWLMRAHGLTSDHLVEADVLTADGTLVRANEAIEPDLLWGLRGGGGNFGIVTRFAFRTVPFDPTVFAGLIAFSMDEGESVLRHYREWAEDLPRTATTIVALRTILPGPMPAALHGRRVVAIVLCSIGPEDTDERLRGAIASFGTPLVDVLARKPFLAHQQMFDPSVPAGNGYYWKSHYLTGLSDEMIDRVIDLHRRTPTPWSYSLVARLGGAVADLPADATAYPFRDPPNLININGVTDDPADDEAAIAWTRETFDAMAPFSTGGVYVNFMGNEGEARVQAAYGPAYARLAALKAHWDPDNVFSVNQNIRPSPAS